jgi:prevent-host-death family protein
MSTITATDAKNRFGQLLEMAQREPVHIQKNGRDVGVLVSPEEYSAFAEFRAKPKGPNPRVMEAHARSVKRWGKVYEALAK